MNRGSPAIYIAVVIPYLNEEKTLAATCASLGFGIGQSSPPQRHFLVLVDNGSTDETSAIAQQIKANSAIDSVLLGREPEQGYVPPRHRGNLMINAFARSRHWNQEAVLILQADADTVYSQNYINSMEQATLAMGLNVMLEACVDYPAWFKKKHSYYIDLSSKTDAMFVQLFARDLNDDDVVDDKVSAYRLSDYFKWGGHRREFTSNGEEIHAETTRLYMCARAQGAHRERVDSAIAFHSPRKVIQDAALHLATAGFPRETSWDDHWRQTHPRTKDFLALCVDQHHPEVVEVIQSRKQHLLALLGVLPVHVDRALGTLSSVESATFANVVLPLLPIRTTADLLTRPGVFLTDVFDLITQHGPTLLSEARKSLAP